MRGKVQVVTRNRVAVVIGGGNGIGEATCRLMVARGWRIVVADREIEAAQRVAQDIGGLLQKSRIGVRVHAERAQFGNDLHGLLACQGTFGGFTGRIERSARSLRRGA